MGRREQRGKSIGYLKRSAVTSGVCHIPWRIAPPAAAAAAAVAPAAAAAAAAAPAVPTDLSGYAFKGIYFLQICVNSHVSLP